jgi:hypothetical protein
MIYLMLLAPATLITIWFLLWKNTERDLIQIHDQSQNPSTNHRADHPGEGRGSSE